MKMYSNEKQEFLIRSGGVWFANFNPTEIPGTPAADETPATLPKWECDSVAIDGEPTREKLIAAGMQARFSKDDEIAIINAKLGGDDSRYATYATYRESIKAQVDAAGFVKVGA